MDIKMDLHTHTVASIHAYSTLRENIEEAYNSGMKVYGFSDHTKGMKGAVDDIYFWNFKVIPRYYKDMLVIGGAEANIIDFDGNIDIGPYTCKKLDYVIASLHVVCLNPGSIEQNTNAYIGAMKNPFVKIIGHPDDSRYAVDYEKLVYEAGRNGVALELNNSSLKPNSSRVGGRDNCRTLLKLCKKENVKIICGTDSHYYLDIGKFDYCKELIAETDFPDELIINNDIKKLKCILNKEVEIR